MSYPNYPNNRLIVNGVDLSIRFQMVLIDGYTLDPPKPKTYSVDVPGGDGVIDLTEALMGDTAYSNRKDSFTFLIINMKDERTFEERKTMVSNFLHGRAFDYKMTMDPEYTYHGRFSIDSYSHSGFPSGILGSITISVDADPYKSKGKMVYKLNATGGKMFRLPSGRKRVHPIIEVTQPARVRFGDTVTQVGAGSYTLNNVLFQEGYNDIYINSKTIQIVKWQDIGDVGGVTGAELIINGDFDYSDEGWEISGDHSIGTDSPHGGVGYLTGSISSLTYSNSIAIRSGRTYLLSVWLKSSSAAVTGTLTLMKSSDGSSFSEWSSTPILPSLADTTKANTWLCAIFPTGTGSSQALPSYSLIASLAASKTKYQVDGTGDILNGSMVDYSYGLIRTLVSFDADTTWTFTYSHDDGSRIYVDGVKVFENAKYTTNDPVTISFTKGHHIVDVMYSNTTWGYGVWAFSVPLSSIATTMYAPAWSEWTQVSVTVTADSTVRYAYPKMTLNGVDISIDDMSLQYNMTGLTWNDARSLRWDDIQRLDINGENAVRSWEELSQKRWSDLASYHWYDIDYRDETVKDTSVYLAYDWKDL